MWPVSDKSAQLHQKSVQSSKIQDKTYSVYIKDDAYIRICYFATTYRGEIAHFQHLLAIFVDYLNSEYRKAGGCGGGACVTIG